ncbi:MAG: helix-turn-helix domain-containing protein [Candidatus Omnitrophica bacterium]|jgi:excisionase family DNA binding protein|nr:helix-turn-helix domain-containing protein [Candidatus Omnitrophota bacterium]MDD5079184.1 helix-turn-helix domain-containing protein [Candidatus Omnitrophota bacterium]
MAEEKLLTVRDVSILLGLNEKEILDLTESGAIPAYNIGGVYLRFKKNQVEEFRKKFRGQQRAQHKFSVQDRVFDFFYFGDFYIISAIAIITALYFIFR